MQKFQTVSHRTGRAVNSYRPHGRYTRKITCSRAVLRFVAVWVDRKSNGGFCDDGTRKGGSCCLLGKDWANGLSQLQYLSAFSWSCALMSLSPVWPNSFISSELMFTGYLSYGFHQTETFLHLGVLWFTRIALRKLQYLCFAFFLEARLKPRHLHLYLA